MFGRGPLAKKSAQSFDLHLKAERKIGNRPVAGSHIYFGELAQKYLDERRALGNVSESYIEDLMWVVNNHIGPILSARPVGELTFTEDMMRVADHYKGRAQATRNRYFTYLKAIFRYGIRIKLTKNNPLQEWKKSKEQPRQFFLTVDDLKKIICSASPHLQWAIEVEFNLGARPGESELLALKWQHVDFEKREVSVYGRKTKEWRQVAISEAFRDRLLVRKQEAQCEFIVDYKGKPFKKFRRSWNTAVKKAGIAYPCRFYDVRHLFATHLLSSGANLKAVSSSLGHSTAKQTVDTYLHLLKGEKERAASLLPDITPG
jgi:integrase